MSRFDDLFWLVEVIEAGTLSAAAEKHHVTSAAVSKRLRLMEERLGVKLLVRTTRHLRTTEAGEMYYKRGKHLLDEFQALEDNVASTRERLCGSIRINAPLSFGLKQLVEPVNAFMEQYPEVNIILHLDDRFIDIHNSDYDLVMRIGTLADSSIIAQRISSTRLVCVASPAYIREHGAPQKPQDLEQHECLIYQQNKSFTRWVFYKKGKKTVVSVTGRLLANNGDVLCLSAINDQGITLQPTFICQSAIDEGKLIPVLSDYTFDSVNIYAMYPSRQYLPLKIKRFIEFIKERLD